MKVLIKKSFAGYPENHIIEIDEFDKTQYASVVYWLRRCQDGEIDGYCELIEWNVRKSEKTKNMIQSKVTDKDKEKDTKKNKKVVKE